MMLVVGAHIVVHSQWQWTTSCAKAQIH